MSVSITLPGDLEQFLQSQAQRMGIPIETLDYANDSRALGSGSRYPPHLPKREADLLRRLKTLFSAEQTHEYRTLYERGDAGTLTASDRERLLSLIELCDHQNAERLAIVAELRGVCLREMMALLGIRPE